jgi:hypothetical protein
MGINRFYIAEANNLTMKHIFQVHVAMLVEGFTLTASTAADPVLCLNFH